MMITCSDTMVSCFVRDRCVHSDIAILPCADPIVTLFVRDCYVHVTIFQDCVMMEMLFARDCHVYGNMVTLLQECIVIVVTPTCIQETVMCMVITS